MPSLKVQWAKYTMTEVVFWLSQFKGKPNQRKVQLLVFQKVIWAKQPVLQLQLEILTLLAISPTQMLVIFWTTHTVMIKIEQMK